MSDAFATKYGPFALVTGDPNGALAQRYRAAPCIAKPFSPAEIDAWVRSLAAPPDSSPGSQQ